MNDASFAKNEHSNETAKPQRSAKFAKQVQLGRWSLLMFRPWRTWRFLGVLAVKAFDRD